MTQYGTWVSYSGDARIELAVGLVAVAGGVTYAGTRLARPARFTTRIGQLGMFSLITAWCVAIVAWLVCVSFYIKQYIHDYPKVSAAPKDPITLVTFSAAVVVFVIIVTRKTPSRRTRIASAAFGAMAAPMIFEFPFDLIVMARTYPPVVPDPAAYRALFFVPLFGIEVLTLALLRLSPMVRLTRYTFFSFALLLAVFAVWALEGFSYPSGPLPIALNVISKILAFVTILTTFQLRGAEDWRPSPAGPAAGPAAAQPSLPGRPA
jgi:hypothetical protein